MSSRGSTDSDEMAMNDDEDMTAMDDGIGATHKQ